MVPKQDTVKVNGSVISIKQSGDNVSICDNLYNYYLLNIQKLNFLKSVNITKKAAPLHKYSKSISTSSNGIICLVLNNSSKSFLIDTRDGLKNFKSLFWHKAGIYTTMFANGDEYILSGGEDGKTFVFKAPDYEPYAILDPRPDYISDFAFEKEGELLAISGFDKKCQIYDLESSKTLGEFETPDIAEAVTFTPQSTVFYACKDGTTGIYSIDEKKKIAESKSINDWPTSLTLLNGGKYCAIATRSNLLYLMDTTSNSLLKTLTFENIGMTKVTQINDALLIGFIDGTISVVNIAENKEELLAAIAVKEIKKLIALCEKNIFLKTYPEFSNFLEENWKSTMKVAIDLLAKNQIQEALQTVSLFIDDAEKKQEFDFYISQKQTIAEFLDAIQGKNVQLAYELANKYPEIKETTEFESLENSWNLAFVNAKKLLYQDPNNNKEPARRILEPFANVKSKKDVVLNLINNSDKYAIADKLVKERSYAQYFTLCEKFTFLKDTDLYKKMLNFAEQVMDNINKLENSQNFQKATEYANLLSTFAPYKNLAKARVKLIEKKLQFIETAQNNEIKRAYALISESPQLKSLNEFIDFNHKVKDIINYAYESALEGRSFIAIDRLGEIAECEYWKEKVCSIMKISYLKEFEINANSHEKDDIDWNKSFEYFIQRYGKIDELQRVAFENKLEGYYKEIKIKGDKEGYKNLPILNTIIARLKN